jgi:ABC-type bacteriocin/lantibiotic exporter with double-glycine peptidase domain
LLALAACTAPFPPWQEGDASSRTTVPVKLVVQESQRDCGAAALTSVMRYWDVPVSLAAIGQEYPPDTTDGYTIGKLLRIARDNGLQAFALPMTEAFIAAQIRLGRPVILPIRKPTAWASVARLPLAGGVYAWLVGDEVMSLNHYVTVVGYGEGYFYLVDPADGYRKILRSELEKLREGFGSAGILVARGGQAAHLPDSGR